MALISIYKCLCDETRLRILNLLRDGPLCVCHFQEILDESQVRVSKQLAYMKRHKLVSATREGHWMIYSLATPMHPVLEENLKCLQDCKTELPQFEKDKQRRKEVVAQTECPECIKSETCC